MFNIIKRRSTHASKLERWLGPNKCAEFSALHQDWYGPPIALAGVPGEVYCRGGGDFVGNIDAGGFQNYWDYSIKRAKDALHQAFLYNKSQMATGFATLAALQDAAKAGYAQEIFLWCSNGPGTQYANDVWSFSSAPVVGAVGANAPGGTVFNSASTRAGKLRNAGSGKTLTATRGQNISTINGIAMLVCDRLFAVNKTMNSTASEAVTGVATRYQSTTSTDPDWAGGNFVYPRTYTVLPATAHNHTVCQYTDQDGNTGVSFPSVAGRASGAALGADLAQGAWFMPLADGDVGVKAITQIQIDALVASGNIEYVLSHPLYWVISPGALGSDSSTWPAFWTSDGITSAMQLVRVFDDACLYVYVPIVNSLNATNALLTLVEG